MSANSLTESEMIRSNYIIPSLLDNKNYVRSLSAARFPKEIQKPGTVKWVARRLDDNSLEMARAILANWVHPSRQREATVENVCRIRKLLDKVAVRALLELAKPRKYVRGCTDGRQLDLELTLGVETVSTTAGCTLLLTEGWLVGGYLYVTTVEYRSRR